MPVRYRIFEEEINPPYITYYVESTDNFGADNGVYSQLRTIVIDLFTEFKDESTEQEIENILNANEIYWNKSEDYIESLHLFMISYEIII